MKYARRIHIKVWERSTSKLVGNTDIFITDIEAYSPPGLPDKVWFRIAYIGEDDLAVAKKCASISDDDIKQFLNVAVYDLSTYRVEFETP